MISICSESMELFLVLRSLLYSTRLYLVQLPWICTGGSAVADCTIDWIGDLLGNRDCKNTSDFYHIVTLHELSNKVGQKQHNNCNLFLALLPRLKAKSFVFEQTVTYVIRATYRVATEFFCNELCCIVFCFVVLFDVKCSTALYYDVLSGALHWPLMRRTRIK